MTEEERLEDLLLSWEESRENGQPMSVEDLCADCPQLSPELRRRIAALLQVGWVKDVGTNESVPQVLSPGVEISPGYRLVRRLGRGGFGEVWCATSPDNETAALKFLPWDAKSSDAERRSVESLRDVAHPNLLRLLGSWEFNGWFIIATELADRTLHDRWLEVQSLGEGIPPEELFRYMIEAANAIDHLHASNIQHRDIKPQNLLLKGDSLKVGDFGLARVQVHSMTGHTGNLTLAYAAPEFFDGKTSRHSDQYSLAMTYCQLRGGRLPFVGSAAQVIAGHLTKPPDLTMLPLSEQQVVAKALSKKPNERWPSCTAFIETLSKTLAVEPIHRRRLSRRQAIGFAALLTVPAFVATRYWPVTATGRPTSAFVFDGTARIVTPVERFAPVSLEAWVWVDSPNSGRNERTIIGSDIPGKSGISIGLEFQGWRTNPRLGAQLLPSPTFRDLPTGQPVELHTWTHIAAVFGEKGTTLYLDGRKVGFGTHTASLGGTPFVIGNAGRDNNEHYFVGRVRTVRISRGERYTGEFSPPESFAPDELAVLIYSADEVDGSIARDLSGNGNHGTMSRIVIQPEAMNP